MATKRCSKCDAIKDWSKFYFISSRGKPRADCIECVNRQRNRTREDRKAKAS